MYIEHREYKDIPSVELSKVFISFIHGTDRVS